MMDDLSLESLFGNLSGKNVVITGGSKGVGLMIAAGFAQQNANVYILSRKPDDEATARLNSMGKGVCKGFACDVANHDAIKSFAETLAREVGDKGVYCLINNSGAVWAEGFDTTTKQSFDKLMNVNVTGLFFMSQALAPLLDLAANESNPARIINIASIDGMGVPTFEEYAYAASKAAVIHMTRVMAGNLAQRHITCNSISPGLFPSKMGDQVLNAGGEDIVKFSIPMGRAGLVSE